MQQTDPTAGTAPPTDALAPTTGTPSVLSPEEVDRRLREAARILVNGAIRVVLNKKRAQGEGPNGDGPSPKASAHKPERAQKRASTADANGAGGS